MKELFRSFDFQKKDYIPTSSKFSLLRKLLFDDPFLYGCVETRRAALKQYKPKLLRSLNPKEKNAFDLFFSNFDIHNFVTQTFEAVLYGYTVIEIVWSKQKNLFIPINSLNCPQEFFRFDNNTLKVLINNKFLPNPYKFKFIPVRNSPSYFNKFEGESLLARCIMPVTLKKEAFKFWTLFLEKYTIPFMLIYHPPNLTQQQIDELLSKAAAAVQDAIIAIPEGASVEFIEAHKQSSSDAFVRFKQECDNEIAVCILGHTGAARPTPGRLGNENTALEVKQDRVQNDVRIAENSLQLLFDFFCQLNSIENVQITLEKVKDFDTFKLAERDAKLSSMIRFTADYFKKTYNLNDSDFIIDSDAEFSTQPPLITINTRTVFEDLVPQLEEAFANGFNEDPTQ